MKLSMKMEFNWDEVEKKNALAQKAATKAARDVAKDIFDKSQKLVPVKTGALKRSGRVNKEQYTKTGFTIQIQYGSDTVNYAVFVHDGTIYMEARKFLEKPLLAAVPQMNSALAAAMSKYWPGTV